VNINEHRDDLAEWFRDFHTNGDDYDFEVWQRDADLLLASPALARLLAAARDEARGEWRGDDCSHYWLLRPESDTHVCLTCGDES